MIKRSAGKTIITMAFVFLALAPAYAEEATALSPGQQFFFDTVAGRRSVRSFKGDEVTRQVLQIPERYERVCITPIGVPSEWPKASAKKELSEFIVYDSFSEK